MKIKPCPFCGGGAKVIVHKFHGLSDSFGVECTQCKTQGWQFYDSEEVAVKKWNKRAPSEYAMPLDSIIPEDT